MMFAFGLLGISLLYTHSEKSMLLYPMMTIFLFAFAQFLIQPTMHACLSNLIHEHKHQVFALGILRSMRAIGAIVAFYLISITIHSKNTTLHQNSFLYLSVAGIALLSIGAYFGVVRRMMNNKSRNDGRVALKFDS